MNGTKLSSLLNFVLIMLAIIGIILFFLAIPAFGRDLARTNPEYAHAYTPWLILTWTVAISYFYVLYQGYIIFREIGKDVPFSKITSKALKNISLASGIESLIFALGNLLFIFMKNMTHGGVFLLSIGFCALGITLSVFASSLSQLVIKAEELKEANDLTI